MRYLPSVTGTFATLTQKYPFSLKAGAVTTNTHQYRHRKSGRAENRSQVFHVQFPIKYIPYYP